ncbi:unnamed protein product [Lymnaea stagnalis]|uniref:Uncharacterized protein n=1 Tax=Lymnaea stagnalis TaxID=6523 RepID=A0AAV2HC15_LYMST
MIKRAEKIHSKMGDEELLLESNSKVRWDNCPKRSGHAAFIPVNEFRRHHLPAGYQDEELKEFILSVAALTTLITVDYVSPNRPLTVSDSQTPYPFSNRRGLFAKRTGSGMVWEVKKITEKDSEESGTCLCFQCRRSPTPRKEWGLVQVLTAPHVVFDSEEVVCSKFSLFQDSEVNETAENSIDGVETVYTMVDNDASCIKCATHNLDLIDKLETLFLKYLKLYLNVKERFKGPHIDKICIVVSHPHGYTKHVSVGTWSSSEGAGSLLPDTRYTYSTSTCPGSSGSPVFVMGTQWCPIIRPHSCSVGKNNESSVYWG